MEIEAATEADATQLHDLIETCYRGEISRTGWTSEVDFLGGIRTTKEAVIKEINTPGTTMFKYTNEEGIIRGCVYSQILEAENKVYLGMLCVYPSLQAKGLGRKLMAAAENSAKTKGFTKTCIRVITRRVELVAWYERQGYKFTGEISPFVARDGNIYGEPKVHVEFGSYEKTLD